MRKKQIPIIFLLLMGLAGCNGTSTNSNTQMIMKSSTVEKDGAEGAWEQLKEEGADDLVSVKKINLDNGNVLMAKDKKGTKWYLVFGELGYLETIYKGSIKSEPVYYNAD